MNLPNRLTILRVLMIPLFLMFFYFGAAEGWTYAFRAAFLTFALASFTDWLDGAIARKYHLVTDFGKLMDPLADKLLVMAAMISFISVDMVHPVIVIVILSREFLVTSIRLVAASKGRVIAADGWGKAKTVLQMLWICYTLLLLCLPSYGFPLEQLPDIWFFIQTGLIVAVTALTVLSGFLYTWRNRHLFAQA